MSTLNYQNLALENTLLQTDKNVGKKKVSRWALPPEDKRENLNEF